MEDSSEGHSQENRISVGKNVKRTIKTPAQFHALEKFYNEHKYPSEELKSEFSEHIGLTEKQISSWFCHRRLKDKKRGEANANGRQDRSSSIIQDLGSGLRQDSSGSTKQGDYRTIDPREVESKRHCNRDFPAAELAHNHASRYKSKVSGFGDLSPQRSSSSEENSMSPKHDLCAVEYSRCMTQNGNVIPPIVTSTIGMLYKPSEYLKVTGEIENAAITAVKRQLGRHYREDGPLLGVEFEPLPPGSFDSPSRDLAPGPLYGGDLIRAQSLDVSGVQKQSCLSSRYDLHASKMVSQDSYLDEANCKEKGSSDSHIRKPYHQLEQHAAFDDYFDSKPASVDKHDDQYGVRSAYHGKRKNQMSSKPNVEGFKSVSFSKRHPLDGRKFKSKKTVSQLYDYDSKAPQTILRNDRRSKPPKLITGYTKTIRSEDRTPHAKMAKEDCGQIKGVNGYIDPAIVALQSRVDFLWKEYGKKESLHSIPKRTKASKRFVSIMEKPSSLNEDEPAATSSSGDQGAEN